MLLSLGLFLVLFCITIFAVALPVHAPIRDTLYAGGASEPAGESEATYSAEQASNIDDSAILSKSYLVYDDAGRIISNRNPKTVVSIASITKLMTASIVLQHGNLNDIVFISHEDVVNVNPSLGLASGDTVLVKDLLMAMLIGSANDAAQALGSYIEVKTGTHMVEMMNRKAQQLGMADTRFHNPIGFDSDTNYSTATDIAVLIEELRTRMSFNEFSRKTAYAFAGIAGKQYTIKATNRLIMKDPELLAVKTGYTDDARGAMVIEFKMPERLVTIIVLQSLNREQDTILLKEKIKQHLLQP